jgi:hypothetical protein
MSSEMLGAFQGVIEDHASRSKSTDSSAPPAKPIGWMIATAMCWSVLLALLLFPPAIARMPDDRPFTSPAGQREASLRFGLWLARHQVDAFVRSNARVPSYGGESVIEDRAIQLEANDRYRYALVAREGPVALRLTSEMSADSFLGRSLIELRASRTYQQAGLPGVTTAR